MGPKPSLNPFIFGLQMPSFKPTARPTFKDFAANLYELNKKDNSHSLTRENILSSWSRHQEKYSSHAKVDGSILDGIARKVDLYRQRNIKKPKPSSSSAYPVSRQAAQFASGSTLQLPKFDYKDNKVLDLHKYVSDLQKLNPDTQITAKLADDLLENHMNDMIKTLALGIKRNDQKAQETARKDTLKRLMSLKGDHKDRDSYWAEQRND